MERLLKTTLVSGQAWHIIVTKGEILFDFPHIILLNTFITPRVPFWMDGMETNGRYPGSRGQLPAEHLKPEVGESCGRVLYLFIKSLLLPRGRAHYFLRCKVFCFATGIDNMQVNTKSVHLSNEGPHFPWSLLLPLLLIMIWAFQFGNNKVTPWKMFSHTPLIMILNTDPLAATKRIYKSWVNKVSSHLESFTILLSCSAHK